MLLSPFFILVKEYKDYALLFFIFGIFYCFTKKIIVLHNHIIPFLRNGLFCPFTYLFKLFFILHNFNKLVSPSIFIFFENKAIFTVYRKFACTSVFKKHSWQTICSGLQWHTTICIKNGTSKSISASPLSFNPLEIWTITVSVHQYIDKMHLLLLILL